MSDLETHVATRKDHRCHDCGRRIPIGARYFVQQDDDTGEYLREHTNCLEFKGEPMLVSNYNSNRKLGEVKYGDDYPEEATCQ